MTGLGRGTALVETHAVGHWRRGRGRDMTNVLEGLGMLEVVRHHRVLGRGVRVAGSGAIVVVILVVVAVFLAHKVLGAFVLVCVAILGAVSAARRWQGEER